MIPTERINRIYVVFGSVCKEEDLYFGATFCLNYWRDAGRLLCQFGGSSGGGVG